MRLEEAWSSAAHDLGLDVTTPFTLVLPSGRVINARVLLRRFGAINGMLLVSEYGEIREAADEITSNGYGYSVLADSQYSRGGFVDMLRDWGWAGDENAKPTWF